MLYEVITVVEIVETVQLLETVKLIQICNPQFEIRNSDFRPPTPNCSLPTKMPPDSPDPPRYRPPHCGQSAALGLLAPFWVQLQQTFDARL